MVKALRRHHVTRDGILFVVGLAGIIHEAVVSDLERPTLLVLFAAMVGLPAFLQRDEKQPPPPTTTSRPEESKDPDALH